MAHIQYLTQIHLDVGVVRRLEEECRSAGITRPLVISAAGVRAISVLDRALGALGPTPHAVFDGTPANPTETAVHAAAALHKNQRCDGLIAVGAAPQSIWPRESRSRIAWRP